MEKPTTGLQPKKLWLEARFKEICTAIAARYDALQSIPVEWIEEYNWLISELKPTDNAE